MRRLRGPAALLLLLALAWLARWQAHDVLGPAIVMEERTLVTGAGDRIAARVYRSSFAVRERTVERRTRPAVVLCHGVSASQRNMDGLARLLPRYGFLVVTFDYGGHGDSARRPALEERNVADVQAAVALARAEGGGPIGLVGHSMGVTSAVAVALADPEVRAVAALGQRPFTTPGRPPALLVAAGAMDPFHPYVALRAAARESAGVPLGAFETAVSPEGAARRLVLSGSCEHAGAVLDGALMGEVEYFFERTLAREPALPGRGAAVHAAAVSASLALLSRALLAAAVAVAALGLGRVLGVESWASSTDRRRRVVAALVLAPALLLAVGGQEGLLERELARDLAPGLFAGALVGGALLRARARGTWLPPRDVLRVLWTCYAAWIGGTLLGAAPAFVAHPELLTGVPLYLWQGIGLRAQFSLDALATSLVPAPGGSALGGGLLPFALVAVELAAPGRLVAGVALLLARLHRALGGRVEALEPPGPLFEPRTARGPGRATVAVGAALTLVAAGLLATRLRDGLLAEEGALGHVGLAALRLLVLPLGAALAGIWLPRLVGRALTRPAATPPAATE